MPVPSNPIKAGLKDGNRQMGLWIALGHPTSAEIASKAGFDFCLIDGEHAPNDIPLVLDQVRAIGCGTAAAAARVPVGETWIIKQYLDLGIQTLVVPMIDTPEQARETVRATRYPPAGNRGVGAAMARASNFGEIADVTTTANDEICLFVQTESNKSVENIDAIANTDGVDGVFIGPADLAADMGLPGQTGHPDVQASVKHCFERIHAAGKKVGIIAFDDRQVRAYVDNGANFVAVGGDTSLLGKAIRGAAAFAGELRDL
ncbi:MAG: HpcH/HpaI aldolase/citrate lyase family protein [Boseongicola sp.]|nr:HpcH/HpaI aldolase/citrate lyase family protein [Boseongicola sp.]NNJ68740.1 HpcH/HpaI aldolase/citrate lyase family protein [Boseongicola sp.]